MARQSHRLIHRYTAKDKADIDQMIDGLSVLTAIPYARLVEVRSQPKDRPTRQQYRFDSETEFAAYKAHDLYQETIKRVRPPR